MVPAYGPNWRFKIPIHSKTEWHIGAHFGQFRRNQIFVAPWNRKRLPKKRRKTGVPRG
jgi:hypothetical protein